MPLINLYYLREMARPREDAMWAVLDWAGSQPKGTTFTLKDLYKIFTDNGGGSTYQQFHSMVKVAKPWKDDQAKYGVSEKRPFVYSTRGAQGGQAHVLQWGLGQPLRTPPQAREPLGAVGTPTGDILDKLEDKMGRPALVAAMKRWKSMTDAHRIAADIRATVPTRYQMDALQVATEHLIDSGRVDQADVEDAEDEVAPAPEQQPGTPFKPKAKAQAKAAPPPADDDEDDEDLGPGWRKLDEPEEKPDWDEDAESDAGFADAEIPNDFFNDAGEAEEEPSDDREWPVFLPDPDDSGDKYERAMASIVDSGKVGEGDPIWGKLKSAKNDVDANQIIKSSKVPKELHRSMLLVAHAIFDNTGRDWETGKKMGESRLTRLYEVSPLTQNVDFDQKSGLSRIYGMDESQEDAIDWQAAERGWPGSGAAWDELNSGEDSNVRLFSLGKLLVAQLGEDLYIYDPNDGAWAGLGPMKFQRMGAYVKFMTNAGSSGPCLYIPVGKSIPHIDVVGPKPEDLPGFEVAARPNGKVSAQKKRPTADDIRQAALAVQTYNKAEPPNG